MAGESSERVSTDITLESKEGPVLPPPATIQTQPAKLGDGIPASAYVILWISVSGSLIIMNKWILDTLNFRYPVLLTTYHLSFATFMTQMLARTTTLIDGRKKINMTPDVYLRGIVPIGVCFSLSLICGNVTYLYLSVSFIQMLKATTPVVVLLSSWAMGNTQPKMSVLLNVSVIVVGVIIASFGEIQFVFVGFVYQILGIIFEALRLTMVEKLLSGEYKMDPLTSVYYYAPVCAVMNFFVALYWEIPKVSFADFANVGFSVFLLNGIVAFTLNLSVVFLIGKTSAVVMTLCGVLKDVLLVVSSMMIWGTPVTALQFFGYSIALGGLVYYKTPYDKLVAQLNDIAIFFQTRGARKLVIGLFVLLAFFYMLSSSSPAPGPMDTPATHA
ncbi:hypothetical protein TD95_000464 [Thielaviopsis punctulata]|uniref:Sugar phosphate transporter domain-containing protein n=1 Tax=Thielaviopsis punctulata TaxID=72032 RepID=A0A0F4ZI93_9PEZI|nr:hypothetical protein TD95_000464 [Thielaviopsis punctulata]